MWVVKQKHNGLERKFFGKLEKVRIDMKWFPYQYASSFQVYNFLSLLNTMGFTFNEWFELLLIHYDLTRNNWFILNVNNFAWVFCMTNSSSKLQSILLVSSIISYRI